jgi:hypothetical protein
MRKWILLAAFAATSALAHHGWSEYDAQRPLTLSGTIEEAGYANPHGFIRLETGTQSWTVVLAPPSRMESRGLARDALAPGKPATVMGYPHRSKDDELRAERITLAGKTTELR